MWLPTVLLLVVACRVQSCFGIYEEGHGLGTHLRTYVDFGQRVRDWLRNTKDEVINWWISIVTPMGGTYARPWDNFGQNGIDLTSSDERVTTRGPRINEPRDESTRSTTSDAEFAYSHDDTTTIGPDVTRLEASTPAIQSTLSSMDTPVTSDNAKSSTAASENEPTTLQDILSTTTETTRLKAEWSTADNIFDTVSERVRSSTTEGVLQTDTPYRESITTPAEFSSGADLSYINSTDYVTSAVDYAANNDTTTVDSPTTLTTADSTLPEHASERFSTTVSETQPTVSSTESTAGYGSTTSVHTTQSNEEQDEERRNNRSLSAEVLMP